MKKQILSATLTAVLAFILLLAGCMALNMALPSVSDGDLLPAEAIGRMHTFGFFETKNGRSRMTLHLEAEPPEMVLLLSGTVSGLRINSREIQSSEYGKRVGGVKSVAIQAEDWLPDGTGRRIVFSVAGDAYQSGASFYLCSRERYESIARFSANMIPIVTGIFAIMAVYGCSLYLFKRSEKYLMLFALYAGALALWFLPSICTIRTPFFRSVCYNSYNCAILLSILMCAQMSGIGRNSPVQLLYRWYAALPVCALITWLISLLPVSSHGMEVMRFALYLVQIVILLEGIAKGRRSFWILMLGLLFSQAVRLVVIQPHYGPIHISVVWLLVEYLRLGIFVFALCCMVFTNRLFARKYQEAETLAHELDAKVQQRTAELVRQQQEQRNLVTNISHDLRTPLFIMKGCLERVRENGSQPEILAIAEDRLAFITRLVNDLFTASKLDDHKLLIETEPFDLSAALQGVVTALALESEDRGIAMHSRIAPGVMAWGDENRLASALQNVIANAVAYTPQGGQIEVQLKEADGKALITVSDNGPGIAPEDLGRIFERYYIANWEEHRVSNGLGLSIAREIVRLHRGDIEVSSRVGEGTEFRITLPRWQKREQ